MQINALFIYKHAVHVLFMHVPLYLLLPPFYMTCSLGLEGKREPAQMVQHLLVWPIRPQMQVSARVQGSVHVNYSPPLWTETETSNQRLYITDWTIYRMTLLKHWITSSFPDHWGMYTDQSWTLYTERKQQGSKLPIFRRSKHQLLSE